MSYEFGITIEKISNVKYHSALCELLEFDEYLGVDTYTPLYWCGDRDLDLDIRLSLVSSVTNDPYIKLCGRDIDNIISLFKYRVDKIRKMKHLLTLEEAEMFADQWQRYESDIKILKRIRALMTQKDFGERGGAVYYFISY